MQTSPRLRPNSSCRGAPLLVKGHYLFKEELANEVKVQTTKLGAASEMESTALNAIEVAREPRK